MACTSPSAKSIGRRRPWSARLFASVPEAVKTISSACAPIESAILLRAFSNSFLASTPSVWSAPALPYKESRRISSRCERAEIGVAAAASTYTLFLNQNILYILEYTVFYARSYQLLSPNCHSVHRARCSAYIAHCGRVCHCAQNPLPQARTRT